MKNITCSLVILLLLSINTQGQVVYTDTNITLSTNNEAVLLNIDKDTSGVREFKILQFVDTAITGSDTNAITASGSYIERVDSAKVTAVVAGIPAGGTHYPLNIPLGNSIDNNTVFRGLHPTEGFGQLALKIEDTVLKYDKFAGGISDGFIGLRFIAKSGDSNTTHYGYLQVSLPANLRSITINGFAYEKTPRKGILAGAGSGLLSNDTYLVSTSWKLQAFKGGVKFLKNNATAPQHVKLSVVNLSGQIVAETKLNAENNFYSLRHLPKGIYLAVAQATNGERRVVKIKR